MIFGRSPIKGSVEVLVKLRVMIVIFAANEISVKRKKRVGS